MSYLKTVLVTFVSPVTNMPDRDIKGREVCFPSQPPGEGGFPSLTVAKAEAVYVTMGQEAEGAGN